MRLATLTILILGILLVTQGHAEDVSIQPLTRVDCEKAEMAWDENANVCSARSVNVSRQPMTRIDCEKAGMPWNDNANVCGVASQVEALPTSDVAEPSPKADALFQPLTRDDCDNAGMTWNETTNVCGEKSEESATQAASQETAPIASTVLINVDKTTQKMTVFLGGVPQYEWPVSTGLAGYTTPSGTYTTSSMNKIWHSREWDNAPMFHAIFYTKRGHAIHGTLDEKNLGKAASHGCVRISRANAETLFAVVKQNGLENTQVVLTGTTPGGEGKLASPARSKSRYGQAARGGERFYAKPRRGGFFRRLFGRR
jgi:lipoprotein-anchoring transpeptidase ErfK/SrfK